VRLEWRGHTLEIRELGGGPALVLLHGYPLDGAMWSSVARRLLGSLRVLKPDLPGRGDNTDLAFPSIEAYADFVAALLEALPAPLGLVGFSMGGYVALALMKRRPEKVRALALVDTRSAAEDQTGKARRDEAIADLRTRGVAAVAEAMVPRLLSPESLRSPELVERVRRIILRQRPETLESDLTAIRDRPDSSGFLKEIPVPTLVLAGEHDVISTPVESRAMADAIPGARFVQISGASHLTPMEKPKAVATVLSEFFSASLTKTSSSLGGSSGTTAAG
jgi:3-oxoadipate enol-lactonase